MSSFCWKRLVGIGGTYLGFGAIARVIYGPSEQPIYKRAIIGVALAAVAPPLRFGSPSCPS